MYPISRLIKTAIVAKRKPAIDITEASEITFLCRPWDLDMFMEMNNGRILTLYDLGRFDLSIRCGLGEALKNNKWGLAVAGSSTRYRKRVTLFNNITMKTQLMGFDDRWFYLAQSMWVNEQPCSSALLRTCITSKGRMVPTSEVADVMGQHGLRIQIPDWVQAWADADNTRPWPPAP